MSELFQQLGINGKALLFQGANFAILLIVLTLAVYRPLVRIMKERRAKIELGVHAGQLAQKRIDEAERIKDERIKAADQKAVAIISEAEHEAGKRGREIVTHAQSKAQDILAETARIAEQKRLEDMERVMAQAQSLVKEALVKTVELEPTQVDEKLIHTALQTLKHSDHAI